MEELLAALARDPSRIRRRLTIAAVGLAYGTNPEQTLELVKNWGVVLLVAMRSKAA